MILCRSLNSQCRINQRYPRLMWMTIIWFILWIYQQDLSVEICFLICGMPKKIKICSPYMQFNNTCKLVKHIISLFSNSKPIYFAGVVTPWHISALFIVSCVSDHVFIVMLRTSLVLLSCQKDVGIFIHWNDRISS